MSILFLKAKWRLEEIFKKNDGMELIQIAVIIGIALVLGFIFRDKIKAFVNGIFSNLNANQFQ
ncbi:MAG: hypothetical protein LBD41_00130 [Clostridiales Family XIII bacterium]|nr:hypothetical protein [Clostridiales Family XIII bacterium]